MNLAEGTALDGAPVARRAPRRTSAYMYAQLDAQGRCTVRFLLRVPRQGRFV
jgi:hypothetical protein